MYEILFVILYSPTLSHPIPSYLILSNPIVSYRVVWCRIILHPILLCLLREVKKSMANFLGNKLDVGYAAVCFRVCKGYPIEGPCET